MLAVLILLLSLSPLFLFKLGQSSLSSFDEAWYAAISRNILLSRDLLNLKFNGSPFADHPPAGFWLIAISQTVFGISEFSARFPSALLGLLCLVLIYLLGQKLASQTVGFASAFTLVSSPWFLLRARSGNLDITLTFFLLLTFYLAILSSKNSKYLIPLGVSFTLLLLTKTMVPFTVIPSLIIILWGSGLNLVFPLTLTFSVTLIWVIAQLLNYPDFIARYLSIGIPQSKTGTTIWENILLAKTYLHHGIGSIFRPAVLSLPFLIFLIKKADFKYILSLAFFILVFLLPFAGSSRGQIWHLIPVFPFMILLFFIIFYSLLSFKSKLLAKILTLTLALTISVPQITKNWSEFIDIPKFISDEAILSRKTSAFPYPLVIDENFLPSAVFYSGKNVIWNSSRDLSTFKVNNQPTLAITHQWLLDQNTRYKNYELLARDRDKVLILLK